MKLLAPLCLVFALSLRTAFGGASPAEVQKALANVPASDPPAGNAPQLLPAVRGVHPRLMFSQADMNALKSKIGSDPILKKTYDGVAFWSKAVALPPGIFSGDQDALVKSYGQAPSLAYLYALDHDGATKQKIVGFLTQMLNAPCWADGGKEIDSSMGAACNMFMTALLYDAAYNDLDPDLRDKLSAKLLTHARRLYWLGHKGKIPDFGGKGYWTADPQPNHRWYRDMGLAACVLAVTGEKGIDTSYLMAGLKEEMDFVAKWYPTDGDCHEGAGYQTFGITAISSAYAMMDRNVGTTYLKTTGIRHGWEQQLYFWVPGRLSDISWGDDQNSAGSGFGHDSASFYLGPAISQDPQAQAALMLKMNKAVEKSGGKPMYFPWTMFAFYDPSLKPSDYKAIPVTKLLPDIGAASMRDSWEDNAVVFTFKCGPMGGYQLNEYRNTVLSNGQRHYINLAHDDPDANEFDLAVGNGFAFHPGNYTSPDKSKKLSAEHSTITIDDKGQVTEGTGFSQPVGLEDMSKFSYLTGWKQDAKGHVIAEGETGAAYTGQDTMSVKKMGNKLDPALLKTFRRTAVWMPHEYILLLDNVVSAGGAHKVTWHGSSPVSKMAPDGKGTATTETGASVPLQIVSDKALQYATVPMTLVGRWGDNPIQQIQATANADAIKFATVLDPWKTGATVKLTSSGGTTTVVVSGTGYNDTWTWNDPKSAVTPSVIDGKRSGASLIALTEADKAPTK